MGGGDLVNVFMCLWVLIINVRMGLKCVYKVIHGITLWDPFLKCGTILWDRDQEIPPNRIRPSSIEHSMLLTHGHTH